MGLFADHPDTVVCEAWAEPHIPLAQKSRIEQNRAGLRLAARDIVSEGIDYARAVAERPTTDARLRPFLREAINAELRRPQRLEN